MCEWLQNSQGISTKGGCDAQGWGLLCQQRCLSFTVAVVAGVMLMVGICPTQSPQQASALIPSRLSP
uniref:Uncharacterized protein n=1 Tax=Bubo bubo TaxID=30461 RepID=A0A8C0F1J3_BUBBB